MTTQLEICGGSVAGRDHVLAGKNNQDSFGWRVLGDGLLAIVCDGCSGGKHSEIGAQLGSQLIMHLIQRHYLQWQRKVSSGRYTEDIEFPLAWWELIRQDVLAEIRHMANCLGDHLPTTINEYFLFTIVGALITPTRIYHFSIGDGFYVVDGNIIRLREGESNTPPYLTYALLPSNIHHQDPTSLEFTVRSYARRDCNSLMLATDGLADLIQHQDNCLPGRSDTVGSLRQFWSDDQLFRNKDLLRRRLTLINRDHLSIDPLNQSFRREAGLLPDDTTLVVIRQVSES